MSERKLKAWQDAGLIDAGTAERLRTWEAEHSRPVGVWAIVGLGALTIAMGIILIVAANWDAIPGEVRLSAHLALMTGLSLWLWWYLQKPARSDVFSDCALALIAVLGLTFFAHVGQVYQTASPLWQPLLAWLLIFSPLLLLFGRGWPVASLWMIGVLGTAWSNADDHGYLWLWGTQVRQLQHPTLYWGLICCPPMLVAALAAAMRRHSSRPMFWRLLEQWAVVTIIGGLSAFIIVRGLESNWHSIIGSVAIQAVALLAAAAVTLMARPTRSGQATAGILAAAAALHIGQVLLLDVNGQIGRAWASALLFLLLWASIAGGARYAGWRDIFQAAIGLIALRIILLSLELNDDLLGNGVSLILSGAFAMLVAWATVQVSKHYAPAREAVP
jgi:hypothetical protein